MGGDPFTVTVRNGWLHDLSALAPTMSDLVELQDPALQVRNHPAPPLCPLADVLEDGPITLLAPCDLQVIKAAGVTFVASMLERVIEERSKGDPAAAAAIRAGLSEQIKIDLPSITPGSPEAVQAKRILSDAGMWSQYLEVGIGSDAEVFTKSQVLSAVGHMAPVGVHPRSAWNNPEPEIVLSCDRNGHIVGAALGNDVNLRDFEGRSALLLSKAKDNNASCAIGPFVRLFDENFSINDVRSAVVSLTIEGRDGFRLDGKSSMSHISRDVDDLVSQVRNRNHQYPDGFVLFCGTMFAPTQDRDEAGQGFTHHEGDRVVIHSPKLGKLINTVTTTDKAPEWTFGIRDLYESLARRGLTY